MITTSVAKFELDRIKNNGLYDLLKSASEAYGVSLPFVLAIGSRETNLTNEIGDYDGQYHGIGILQIDIQHPIALQARDSGSWKTNPKPLIDYGVQMLANNMKHAAMYYPQFEGGPDKYGWCKIAAAAYNSGWGNAAEGVRIGDVDSNTTGYNYGYDVVSRMKVFKTILGEN